MKEKYNFLYFKTTPLSQLGGHICNGSNAYKCVCNTQKKELNKQINLPDYAYI